MVTIETTVRAPASGGGVSIKPGVVVGPVAGLLVRILERYPKRGEIYVSSALRPGDGDSHHSGLDYKGSPTAAVDIGGGGVNPEGSRRMRDAAKWLYDSFADDTVELIHMTPYADDWGFYVKDGRRHPGGGPYSEATRRAHRDHVHFATSKALAEKILAGRNPVPGDGPPYPGKPLRRGSRGGHVRAVQDRLKGLEWKRLAADGDFGSATEAAVRDFQRKRGLVADGVVGPATWDALW